MALSQSRAPCVQGKKSKCDGTFKEVEMQLFNFRSEVAQLFPTLCDPMDCSLPGFSVHGIFQARYWSGLPFPSPGDLPNPGIESMSCTFCIGRFFTLSHQGSPGSEIETFNKIGKIVNSVFYLLSTFQILRALESCHFLIPELRILLFCSP